MDKPTVALGLRRGERTGPRCSTSSASTDAPDPEITMVEVAKRLGVAASTLYRHLPRARTMALEA